MARPGKERKTWTASTAAPATKVKELKMRYSYAVDSAVGTLRRGG